MAVFSRGPDNTKPRLLALGLLVLLVMIQYPLWFGKGSERHIAELKVQIAEQVRINEKLRDEISRLEAETESLRDGHDAIETRARSRLNMIKDNEVLISLGNE